MPKPLTASDRTALLNLASSLPKGSGERRAILAGLKKVSGPQPEPNQSYEIEVVDYFGIKRPAPHQGLKKRFRNLRELDRFMDVGYKQMDKYLYSPGWDTDPRILAWREANPFHSEEELGILTTGADGSEWGWAGGVWEPN